MVGIILFLGLSIWLWVKGDLIKTLKQNNEHINESMHLLNNVKDLEVKIDKSLQNTTFQDISIYIPEAFELDSHQKEENTGCYLLKEEMSETSQAKIYLSSLITLKKDLEELKKDSSFISEKTITKLEKKYNLNDPIDYMKYYKEHQNDKKTIFTSMQQIAFDNYIQNYISIISFGGNGETYFLTGDLKGYMYQNEKAFTLLLVEENKIYTVNLYNLKEVLNEEEVHKILQSITIA